MAYKSYIKQQDGRATNCNWKNLIGRIALSLSADSVANKAATVVKSNVFIAFSISSILFLAIIYYFFQAQKNFSVRKVLEKNNTDLKAAKQAAEEANGYKDLFVSKVSHELRTPLNAIIGTIHILDKKSVGSTVNLNKPYINRIE